MTQVIDHLTDLFGVSSDAHAIEALARSATLSSAPQGAKLFASGDVCENFIILASGCARVQLSTKTGRDIMLFRLNRGQSCALTTSCLLSESPYYAEGIAETDLEIISIPASAFQSALAASPNMMRFLLSDYASRVAELTTIVDRLVHRDLNVELAALLLLKVDRAGMVTSSHQALADELGTAREVVSRKLKDWEKQRWVTLRRGALSLKNLEAIRRLAAE